MSKIIVVQPVIPSYRVAFFNRIKKLIGEEVCFYASTTDQLGVNSVTSSVISYFSLGKIITVFPGVLYQLGVDKINIQKGDVVVINGNPRFISNYYLLLKSKLKGAKVIWWGHGWSSTSIRWRALIRIWLMSFFDYILLYTDAEIDKIKSLGYKKNNISALNNGLDVKSIQTMEQVSERGNLTDILFIGRLTEKSKLDQLLHAISMLKKDEIYFHLHVIGDGPFKHKYNDLADALNINDQVIWHGKIYNEDKIAVVANRCRAFVYPGEVGLSIIHSFAYGLPAIVHSNYSHHMPEIAAFEDGYNGISFVENDVFSLSNSLKLILTDDCLVSHLSAQAKKTVSDSFNLEDMLERFYLVIKRLM